MIVDTIRKSITPQANTLATSGSRSRNVRPIVNLAHRAGATDVVGRRDLRGDLLGRIGAPPKWSPPARAPAGRKN